jgi:hypothetical protein
MSQGFCSPLINTVRVSVGVSVDAGGAGGEGAGGGAGGDPAGGGEPVGAGESTEELPPPHAKSALVVPKESAKKVAARFMMNSLSRVIQPVLLIAAKL